MCGEVVYLNLKGNILFCYYFGAFWMRMAFSAQKKLLKNYETLYFILLPPYPQWN